MGEIQFSDNCCDHSVQYGVNAGFQYEFYCERCNDTWRTDFVPYRGAQASGWISKVTGMFGGVLGYVGDAIDGLAESGWGKARDSAFSSAVEQAKHHFHRCGKCYQYVCDTCWNRDKGLCLNCAPDAEVEVEAARSQGEAAAAMEEADAEGRSRGKKMDVKRDRQLVCPKCKTETHGAKFCPECGFALAVKGKCPKCSTVASPGAKFCPECGQSLGT